MVTGRVSQKTYSTLGHKIFSCFTVDGKLAQEEISHLQQFMDGLDLKRRIPENEKGFLNVIFNLLCIGIALAFKNKKIIQLLHSHFGGKIACTRYFKKGAPQSRSRSKGVC